MQLTISDEGGPGLRALLVDADPRFSVEMDEDMGRLYLAMEAGEGPDLVSVRLNLGGDLDKWTQVATQLHEQALAVWHAVAWQRQLASGAEIQAALLEYGKGDSHH